MAKPFCFNCPDCSTETQLELEKFLSLKVGNMLVCPTCGCKLKVIAVAKPKKVKIWLVCENDVIYKLTLSNEEKALLMQQQ